MNKNEVKEAVGFVAGAVVVVLAIHQLWKDATDPNAYDHLTKQPDGTYK